MYFGGLFNTINPLLFKTAFTTFWGQFFIINPQYPVKFITFINPA